MSGELLTIQDIAARRKARMSRSAASGLLNCAAYLDVSSKWLFRELVGWVGIPKQKTSAEITNTFWRVFSYVCGGDSFAPAEMEYIIGASTLLARAGGDGFPNIKELSEMYVSAHPDEIEPPVLMRELQVLAADPVCQRYGYPRLITYFAILAANGDGSYSAEEQERVEECAVAMGLSTQFVRNAEQMAAADRELRHRRIALLYPDGVPPP
eukprot:NODE_473_length_1634_cov_202.718612_g357_i0.p2 GENE.NODE_473_length_1634_cov_202.718612_g357_i0~~NODE_473_length_1634_cov_202.718612_g357_i0.p2  ORF type:complete len:211 (-),score=43.75 NODE_473_length_1634_cov_202.718612_g357_i0:76-708(-)